jgi:hypothetical protein
MDRETELKEQLIALQLEYNEKAKPLVDELMKIEALKPPRPIVVPASGGLLDMLAPLFDSLQSGGCGDPECEVCQGRKPEGTTVQ